MRIIEFLFYNDGASKHEGNAMKVLVIGMLIGIPLALAVSPHATAEDVEPPPNATCRFVVAGKAYIDGPCWVVFEEPGSPSFSFDDGKMKIECPNGGTDCHGYEMVTLQTGTFGMLTTDESSRTSGFISWNGGEAQAAHSSISPVILRDGCWIASDAELCVQIN